jgi:catechol 2,3-dioxygenase-like lactoylglutathione lyase family enzyme
MFKRLAHVSISAVNLKEAEHFYCEVLGLKKQFLFKKDSELFGFYLAMGENTYLEVFTEPGAEIGKNPLIKHLCFEVEDIDAAIAHIRGGGWPIGEKKLGTDQTWQVWLADPSGIPIELHQYTAESSQFNGRDCIVDW